MPWLQISISTSKASSKLAENILLDNGACSVTLKDAADEPILEPAPGKTPVWQNAIVTGLFENTKNNDDLITRIKTSLKLSLENSEHALEVETLEDQDWSRSWMDHYQPMQFGKRLWVCPWHVDPPEPEAINLRLDPGLAFGTGTHPTTSLCLKWLDKHCNHQSSLLDFGCGSGILAIAALMLGVQQADGVDIDPQALQASLANAKANHVNNRLHLITADQQSKHDIKQYEIVVANILSGPLVELAPTLAKYTLPDGDIVLSGILREQAEDVLNAYEVFFKMDTPVIEDDWVLLHGCRSS
jgi:ribosomal protein L11 methyltransferase